MAFAIETSNVTSYQMSGTSHSFSHTNTAGNLLILCVSWAANTGRTMNTPTYNGVSMTQLTNSPVAEPNNGFQTAIWYLKAPATGSNTLAFTTNGAGTAGFAAAYCFTDADQTTTFGTSVSNTGSSGSPTVTVSSATGEIVIDSCCLNSRTFSSAGTNQTAIFMQSGTATNPRLATSQEAGASSVTMSWNISSSGNWSILAVAVKPASGNTAYTQNLGGALTPAGSLLKAVSASKTGSVPSAGAVTRAVSQTKSGAITPAGAVTNQVSQAKSGSITPGGGLTNSTAKSFAGGITPAGALEALKVILLSLAGSIDPSGSLTKAVSKGLSGAAASAGAVVSAISKSFGGSVTPSGALTNLRVTLLSLAGSIVPSGSLTKVIGKSLSGAITPASSLAKAISKTFAGAISSIGSLISVVTNPSVKLDVSLDFAPVTDVDLDITAATSVTLGHGSATSISVRFSTV